MRKLLGIIAVALVALGVWAWTPDSDLDALWDDYGAGGVCAEADGMVVHSRASGPEDAPVLVMIHGTSASLHTWEPLRERLDGEFRVVAYDQPGHGLTGPHPDGLYTYRGMEDGLEAALDAHGVGRAVLVGNSMGGWVAWRAALAMPERVAGLVLIDPSGMPTEEEAEGNLAFRLAANPVGRAVLRHVTPRGMVESSLRESVSQEAVVTDAAVDRYWRLTRRPGNRDAMTDMFATSREDLSGRLGEITVPTLVLWGEEDALIPVSSAARFRDAIPGAELVVYPGVGHLPMEEVPDAVAEDVRAFLGGHDILPRAGIKAPAVRCRLG